MELLQQLLIAILITSSYTYNVRTGKPHKNLKLLNQHKNKKSLDLNLGTSLISNYPLNHQPYNDFFNHYARPFDIHGFQGLLFNCDNLKPGFYADVYNDCKHFYLCYEPNVKFNPFKQLAMTIYTCPASTYFNQKKQTCTPLENFEMSCHEQLNLFKSNKNLDKLNFKFKDNKIFEYNGKSILNEYLIKNHPEVVSFLLSKYSNESNNEINDKLVNDQPYSTTASSSESSSENSLENTRIENNVTESILIDDEILDNENKELPDIIETTFSCDKRPHGYYVDIMNDCVIFHLCQIYDDKKTYNMNSFRCPKSTVFNQLALTCTHPHDLKVPCEKQEIFFPNLSDDNIDPPASSLDPNLDFNLGGSNSNLDSNSSFNLNFSSNSNLDSNSNSNSSSNLDINSDNIEINTNPTF